MCDKTQSLYTDPYILRCRVVKYSLRKRLLDAPGHTLENDIYLRSAIWGLQLGTWEQRPLSPFSTTSPLFLKEDTTTVSISANHTECTDMCFKVQIRCMLQVRSYSLSFYVSTGQSFGSISYSMAMQYLGESIFPWWFGPFQPPE